ncbi:MAG: amidase family protein [Acidimicrobiales bacterium]
MTDLLAPLTELLTALARRDVSARELLDAHLERIDRLDGPTNAVVTLEPDRARAEAAAGDDARAAGGALGPVAGVAITLQDALATEGLRSTGGAVELRDHVPDTDATAVARARDAGAIVFGKTNLPRWSGDVQSFNELFGTTNNPWNTDHTPGGSSGGAATAVAMGFTGFEIGTDIGGSVRVPASNCGVYGHKPSFGLIPTDGYLDCPSGGSTHADVNVFGPLGRSVDDVELVFDLLVGADPDDGTAWGLDLPDARATALEDFRVVAWLDDDFCPVSEEVAGVLAAAVDQLEAAGCGIDRERRPAFDPADAARVGLSLISAATDISLTDPEWEAKVASGAAISHRDWDRLNRRRALIRRDWADFFADVDVVLCPVGPTPPIRHVQSELGSNLQYSVLADHGDRPYRDLTAWTGLIGSAYLPVTVPPVGRTAADLPIGIQVVAPYLHDRTSLAFARAMADVVGGYESPPLAAG